jgi:Helix-turn-helix domain
MAIPRRVLPVMPDALFREGLMASSDFFSQLPAEDRHLTRAETAVYLRRSVPTLERWAAQGLGPAWRKVGGRILYLLSDVRRFASGEKPERDA